MSGDTPVPGQPGGPDGPPGPEQSQPLPLPDDPLGIIDGLLPILEAMRGCVRVFVKDGYTEAQARELTTVLYCSVMRNGPPG